MERDPLKEDVFDVQADGALRAQILTNLAAETMTDRERARFFGLPEGCRIRERAKILCPEKLVCGKNVYIGEGAMLDASGGLTIGDYTQIGFNAMISTHSSYLQAIACETGQSREGIVCKPTRIGKGCFIAGPSVVAAGVTIGDRVVVAPLTFIEKDVPSDTIVNPHREARKQGETAKKLAERLEKVERELARLAGAG